jgi:Domain of unknown function (DUF4349)
MDTHWRRRTVTTAAALWRRGPVRLGLAGVGLVALLAATWVVAVASATLAPSTSTERAAGTGTERASGPGSPASGTQPPGSAPDIQDKPGATTRGPASSMPGNPSIGTSEQDRPRAAPMVEGQTGSEPTDGQPRSKIVPPPGPGGPDVPVDVSGASQERSMVRTARLELTASDVPAVAGRVRAIAAGVGGFVASEQSLDRSATFTLRIPAPRLDEVMTQLSGEGTVTTRTEQADDVTDQLADLDGRVQTAKASVARVRALLDKATTVGDVVMIESELTQREAELESLTKRLAAVTGRVALSTLTVRLTPAPAPDAPPPGGGFRAGLTAGWHALLTAGAALLTVCGAVLPFLLPLAVLGGVVLLARRIPRRRSSTTPADGSSAADA